MFKASRAIRFPVSPLLQPNLHSGHAYGRKNRKNVPEESFGDSQDNDWLHVAGGARLLAGAEAPEAIPELSGLPEVRRTKSPICFGELSEFR